MIVVGVKATTFSFITVKLHKKTRANLSQEAFDIEDIEVDIDFQSN